jgi:hypothetical protein
MKMTKLKGLTVATLALAVGGIAWGHSMAAHQESSDDSTTDPADDSSSMMSGGMMSGEGHGMMGGQGGMMGSGGMMDGNGHMQQMMQMWGMTPEMMQRGHMMTHAALTRDDPSAILGLKEQLGLTDDQVAKLEALQKKTNEDARATLTDEQRAQLENLPAGPGSMAQMYGQMMAHMQQMYGESGEATETCPMMQMMMGNMMGGGQHQEHHD